MTYLLKWGSRNKKGRLKQSILSENVLQITSKKHWTLKCAIKQLSLYLLWKAFSSIERKITQCVVKTIYFVRKCFINNIQEASNIEVHHEAVKQI